MFHPKHHIPLGFYKKPREQTFFENYIVYTESIKPSETKKRSSLFVELSAKLSQESLFPRAGKSTKSIFPIKSENSAIFEWITLDLEPFLSQIWLMALKYPQMHHSPLARDDFNLISSTINFLLSIIWKEEYTLIT